ncbi:MAG: TMEM198/TM7SF3 family protein [Anaerolineae bacterium]|jgi:hypothetical protein|nr:TMEM198/TM7SF3 family protein [Anaerolineae bacterium]
MLENLLIGIAAIILGLIVAFAGYPLFRLVLPIAGLVYGFQIANAVFSSWLIGLIVGLVLAVVLAVFAYAIWSVAIGFAGAILGLSIGASVGNGLNLWGWLVALLAIALGVLFFVLAFRLKDLFVIISTSLSGAGMVAFGASTLLPIIFGPPDGPFFLHWVLWLGVAVVGFGVQYALFSSARQYAALLDQSPTNFVAPSA